MSNESLVYGLEVRNRRFSPFDIDHMQYNPPRTKVVLRSASQHIVLYSQYLNIKSNLSSRNVPVSIQYLVAFHCQ
jgi:hypothetical protein